MNDSVGKTSGSRWDLLDEESCRGLSSASCIYLEQCFQTKGQKHLWGSCENAESDLVSWVWGLEVWHC